MVYSLSDILQTWQLDLTLQGTYFCSSPIPPVKEGDKKKRMAFCAGGDVKSVYSIGIQYPDDIRQTTTFFREEYKVNYMIATQLKPQISIWDGIVMGGGVGISIHGKYRIATDNTLFAMPETGIGLFPDVGGTFFLPRLKGSLGTYIALTGKRLKGDDLMYAGLATHYVPSNKVENLKQALIQASKISNEKDATTNDKDKTLDLYASVLMSFHEGKGEQMSYLAQHQKLIDQIFHGKTCVEDIIIALQEQQSCKTDQSSHLFAQQTLDTLLKMSPTSLKVTFEGLRRGKQLNDIGSCLQMEYRMANGFMRQGSDFYEGIRALLVDKDQSPKWNPTKLEEVTDDYVESFFQHLGDDELSFSVNTNDGNQKPKL
jgi:enoyl-CoA hydratase/carnithine racemase